MVPGSGAVPPIWDPAGLAADVRRADPIAHFQGTCRHPFFTIGDLNPAAATNPTFEHTNARGRTWGTAKPGRAGRSRG